jgi:tRNA-Thr(GGU) m(6)t(6)A37 methyltransferase TsaA
VGSSGAPPFVVRPIGHVESPLADRALAPRQGHEGAPEAVLAIDADAWVGCADLRPGDAIVVITWLHLADRDQLVVRPRDEASRPLTGVFSTRSADRPNPIGLHEVEIVAIDGSAIRVRPLEAVDGTPILDIKPVIGRPDAR